MAKIQRIRSRTKTISGGSILHNGITTDGPVRESYTQTITDWVKKGFYDLIGLAPPSDLSIYTRERTGGIVSHSMKYKNDSFYNKRIQSCYVTLLGSTPGAPPGGWDDLEGGSAVLTAKLLARTNPFRYSVSIPVMLLELSEAATLLGSLKSTILGNIGSAWLTKVYSIDTMMSDIRSLSRITSQIESRIREFNSLVSKGGLRRKKVELGTFSRIGTQISGTIFSAASTTFSGRCTPSFKSKVWGSVRWVPKRDSPVDLTKLANANDAMRIILDLQAPDASTIWEAIPFSFVVDYFSNVGDVLQSLENTDLVIPTDICIMRERWCEYETEFVPASWHNQVIIGGSGGGTTYVTQYDTGVTKHHFRLREVRTVDDVGDLLSFGICTPKQYLNLVALLSVLRSRKASFR